MRNPATPLVIMISVKAIKYLSPERVFLQGEAGSATTVSASSQSQSSLITGAYLFRRSHFIKKTISMACA